MRKGILALIAYSIFNSVLFFMVGYNLGGKAKTEFYDTLIRNMLPNDVATGTRWEKTPAYWSAGDTLIATGTYYITENGVGRSWVEAYSGKYKSWIDVP